MADHILNRKKIIQALKEELVGPAPQGEEIDCSGKIMVDVERMYKPWKQKDSGEEILQDQPGKRYGVGVLYPFRTPSEFANEELPLFDQIDDADELINDGENIFTDKSLQNIEEIEKRVGNDVSEGENDDLDLSIRNAYKPSSMGVSFLAEFLEGSKLIVKASGARYERRKVEILGKLEKEIEEETEESKKGKKANKERTWWLRVPISLDAEFDVESIYSAKNQLIKPNKLTISDNAKLNLQVEVLARPTVDKEIFLVTVCLVNREQRASDELCLFQTQFHLSVISLAGNNNILPYPGPPAEKLDSEELSLALLYENTKTYAVGHNCAADWGRPSDNKVSYINAECLPIVETPSITPDIRRADGSPIEVSMADLAGLTNNNGFEALSEIIELYEKWIDERNQEIPFLGDKYQSAALRHLEDCKRSVGRMKAGLDYLQTDQMALKAFRLANQAILLQQLCSRREPRKINIDPKNFSISFSEDYKEPNIKNSLPGRGKWRAFQIAFLLMTVNSVAETDSPEREIVELIWFPTGGGKTEAYLGLAAYSIFMRRLKDPDDVGVQVLMRYTLRLLTAQQFQRAAGLLCAMEYLRRKEIDVLGKEEFSIGIWLGGSTTPNTSLAALNVLKSLQKGDRFTENLFILTRCPWCSAQIGPIKYTGKKPNKAPNVIGYEPQE